MPGLLEALMQAGGQSRRGPTPEELNMRFQAQNGYPGGQASTTDAGDGPLLVPGPSGPFRPAVPSSYGAYMQGHDANPQGMDGPNADQVEAAMMNGGAPISPFKMTPHTSQGQRGAAPAGYMDGQSANPVGGPMSDEDIRALIGALSLRGR